MYACEYGHLGIIQALLNAKGKQIKLNNTIILSEVGICSNMDQQYLITGEHLYECNYIYLALKGKLILIMLFIN